MPLDPDRLLGRHIGPYTLETLIGEGGYAWVFGGRHTERGTGVALKVLRPRYAADPQFESRFRNEYRVASRLQHPNIVRILDVGRTGDITYFAMERFPETLADRIARHGPVPERELLVLARGVASALAFAHRAGIVHRDIKAANILLTPEGHPVLTDFGIARALSGYASATGVDMTIGTPHYIAPEQAQGRPLDGRTDLYALGVTLYKAATGTLPFRATDWFELARMHVEQPPLAPRKREARVSQETERIIMTLLNKRPADRYPSADALLAELARPSGPTATPTSHTARPKPVRWVIAGTVILLVVAVALALLGG